MKILKWIVYVIVSIVVNTSINSALFNVLKLGEEKKEEEREVLDAELY